MCIFIAEADVKNTQIFVAPLENKQVIVYENTAQSTVYNAMVLPVPLNSMESGVTLIDMSAYTNLWAELDKYFPIEKSGGWGMASFGSSAQSVVLPIHKVGGYDCSIAPTLLDMARLQSDHFNLPANVKDILEKHYSQGYAFVICRFRSSVVQHHPIGIVSDRLANGALFIPTMHEHNDGAPKVSPGFHNIGGPKLAPEFHNFPSQPLVFLTTHDGVNCDICRMTPIRTTRYKCTICEDFDMCSACVDKHDPAHITWRIKVPLSPEKNGLLNAFSEHIPSDMCVDTQSHTTAHYDHTIYVANAILVADFADVTRIESANCPNPPVVNLGFVPDSTFVIRSLQRIKIVGLKPNRDFCAKAVFE